MSTLPTFSTNDLRSASIDYKRDHEQKKWAHGISFGPGTDAEHGRPVKPGAKYVLNLHYSLLDGDTLTSSHRAAASAAAKPQPSKKRGEHAAKQAQRQEILREKYAASDSSADEDVASPMAAPTPSAADVVYFSYDAHGGPSHGSQILNAALAKAIDKYESKATDQIVKDEYDVLDANGEVVPSVPAPRGKKARRADRLVAVPLIADDDYEFV